MNAKSNIAKALDKLKAEFGELNLSPFYPNSAQGFIGDDFINLVVGFSFRGSLCQLKECLNQIERQCGRIREMESQMTSRPMDLDLLTFGNSVGHFDGIQLPRRDVYDRDFVRLPLRQLLKSLPELSTFDEMLLEIVEDES